MPGIMWVLFLQFEVTKIFLGYYRIVHGSSARGSCSSECEPWKYCIDVNNVHVIISTRINQRLLHFVISVIVLLFKKCIDKLW